MAIALLVAGPAQTLWIPGQTLFASTSSYSSLVQSQPVQSLVPINAQVLQLLWWKTKQLHYSYIHIYIYIKWEKQFTVGTCSPHFNQSPLPNNLLSVNPNLNNWNWSKLKSETTRMIPIRVWEYNHKHLCKWRNWTTADSCRQVRFQVQFQVQFQVESWMLNLQLECWTL